MLRQIGIRIHEVFKKYNWADFFKKSTKNDNEKKKNRLLLINFTKIYSFSYNMEHYFHYANKLKLSLFKIK